MAKASLTAIDPVPQRNAILRILRGFRLPPDIYRDWHPACKTPIKAMKLNSKSLFTAAAMLMALTAAPVTFADPAHDHGKEVKKEEVKPYKPNTCIVSGDKLGEMGKPVVFTYQGQEIKLCCKDCRKDFDKDPAKYLK
jgi:YHS domain-containing protein